MKKEIELKFQVDDFSPVRKKLRELGAKCSFAGREKNWFFDTKAKALRKNKIMLRVRERERGYLTLKERSTIEHGMKVAHEYEVVVGNVKALHSILKHCGFIVYFQYSKGREHWELPDAHIELDILSPKLKFVEVEASKKKIKRLAKILGLDFAKSTTKTYPELLRGRDVI